MGGSYGHKVGMSTWNLHQNFDLNRSSRNADSEAGCKRFNVISHTRYILRPRVH